MTACEFEAIAGLGIGTDCEQHDGEGGEGLHKIDQEYTASMIQVRDLRHSFGDREVLRGISLTISKGETVTVMGSSGGGKTTLLRCMAGLLNPTSGSVEVFGENIHSISDAKFNEIRKRMGILFQGAALFDYLNVGDNIGFGVTRQRKISKEDLSNLVKEKLNLVGLESIEKMMPDELSGGMKKRVGLARALASEPEILFYDEPTSGLDPITAYSIDALIRELADKLHVTSVVISHDLHSVLRVADRVIFLDNGEIVSDGPPEKFQSSKDTRIQEVIRKAEAEDLSIKI